MKAWLQAFGYNDATKDATINAILREFVMSKVSCDEMCNMDMIEELLRSQLEVTKEDIEPVIIMGLCHHRDLIGLSSSFIKAKQSYCREAGYIRNRYVQGGEPAVSHK